MHKLVYFEQFVDMNNAILREKRLKKWNRDWKNKLIDDKNPSWADCALGGRKRKKAQLALSPLE